MCRAKPIINSCKLNEQKKDKKFHNNRLEFRRSANSEIEFGPHVRSE